MSKQEKEEFEFKLPFVPATPFRPILRKPSLIPAVKQGNQTLQLNCIMSESCSSGVTHKVACSNNSSSCREVNGGDNSLKAALFGNTCISDDGNGQMRCPLDLTKLKDVPFADLVAIASTPSSASMNAAADGINRITVPVHVDLSSQESIQNDGDCTPKKHQNVITTQNYDPNQPSGTMDALSQTSISDFAPTTPDKATRAETKRTSETDNLYTENRITNELAAARVDGNEVQCSKEHPEHVTESSLAPITENGNPNDEGNNLIELGRTPQQKQRRKKLRPKVITEGKPRKPRKQATPNPNNTQETPTGKRKYVRKNSINKDTSISPEEANTENSTRKRKYVRRKGLKNDSVSPIKKESGEAATCPEKLQHNKRPCRRALDFDVEEQENGVGSVFKSDCKLNSSSGAKDVGKEGNQSKATVQLCGKIEVATENTETGIAYELNHSLNHNLMDNITLPEGQAPCTPLPTKNNHPRTRQNAHSAKLNDETGNDQAIDHNGLEENGQTMLHFNAQLPARSPSECNHSNSPVSEGGQASELKIINTTTTLEADTRAANFYGSHYNNSYIYQMIPGMQFSNIHRRKRSEKAQNSATSCASSSITVAKSCVSAEEHVVDNIEVNPHHFSPNGVQEKSEAGNKFPTFHYIMEISKTDSLNRKRTRGTTRIQDLASFNGLASCSRHPECCSSQSLVNFSMQKGGKSEIPTTNIEALVTGMQAKLAKKKRTKKISSLVDSKCSSTNEANKKLVLSNHNQFSAKLLGAPPEAIWEQMFSTDAVVEQFNHLNINRKDNPTGDQWRTALIPYNMTYQEHNALVLYRDGTMVPFFPIKKRRPRPKVDLDEETNRVWQLLLQNINSEGIDGTDEEKAKWWEEERRVFRGRADSFIARMHLVQGDRRFSPWKGSVLDSVIGVFLTQNVSDHLSSSAFMSLAAHFPLKSEGKDKSRQQEGTSLMTGAEFYILEPEDTVKWDTKTFIQPVGDQGSMIVNSSGHSEEKEAVKSIELSVSTATISTINGSKCKQLNSSGTSLDTCYDPTSNRSNMERTGNGTESSKGDEETYDALSSQNSVVTSENSVDFSMVQTAERVGSCSESNSEGGCPTKWPIFKIKDSTSFVQLVQMAGSARLHEVYGHQNMSTIENSKVETSQYKNEHKGNWVNSEVPKSFIREVISPSPNCHPHHNLDSEVRENEHFEMFKDERSSEASKTKVGDVIKGQSPVAEESACQIMDQNDSTMSLQIQQNKTTAPNCQVDLLQDPRNLTGSSADAQKKELLRCVNISKFSGEILDITESTTTFDNQRSPQQKMKESNFYTHDSSSNKELQGMNAGTSKSKGRKTKKEKNDDFDWDGLRKQAEANGRKRERTEKTMDSVDWEAVRCADVNEIANTIKERGMNNLLAERIKDFLNRLVREHGSIDLEWLRDVPPDKAKEYLLSIRGLGLKSVECVRLLTLHHLAFPVDTNVGRIAVRLGWVPLQPLPESLQLHLLELYPVLESIQKYLWPRLCKLDQRTLYELHYQMITFGKVFCTKNKPNCNACPMRGECRHFASAFASARLNLPGPEDKSIVSATENRRSDQNDTVITDQLALPLPQPTEGADRNMQSEKNHQSVAISGVNNFDPIIEEPASPEPECTQVAENDIEEKFFEDPDEIPTINLNIEEFTLNLQNYMQNNMELQEGDMSRALVALTAEAASIPTPKLKNVSQLRTEHQVYELPDSHPLLKELDKREPDDPCKYLLAIWTPGETANSIQPPQRRCESQEHGNLCDEKTCLSCNSIREAESQIVRGTLLIPCRTAMKGSFPLNGTYFQVNEVFADHDSSLNPINVPREWLWNLPRRMVYFGTSVPSIFKGLTTEGIQQCFWRGFVCVRGFDKKTRAPRPLMARLHFPASKLNRGKGRS